MSGFIYGLVDPLTKLIRYIGMAIDIRRPFIHAQKSRLRSPSHKNSWIQSLLHQNLMYEVVILDATSEDLPTLERWWIALGRCFDWPLTNDTDGGEGVLNPSVESRAKMSAAHGPHRFYPGAVGNTARRREITGQKFGRLLAIEHMVGKKWLFLCDCGNKKIINADNVCRGLSRSCGCRQGYSTRFGVRS